MVGEIEIRGRITCFKVGSSVVYRVNVPRSLVKVIPQLREILSEGRVGVCLWEECFEASVFKMPYNRNGSRDVRFYITIPKRVVEDYELGCRSEVLLKVIIPMEEKGRMGRKGEKGENIGDNDG